MIPFSNNHTHSTISSGRGRDCIHQVEALIDKAIERGYQGITITEHDTIGSHVSAVKHAKDKPIKVLLGNEIYLCRNDLTKETYNSATDKYHHFILIAKDEEGYDQIKHLSDRAAVQGWNSFVVRTPTYYSDIEEIIGENPGHVVATSACLGGFLPTHLMKDDYAQAKKFGQWCNKVFGDDFYVELQPNPENIDQQICNQKLVRFAKENGLKLTVATDAHYLDKEDRDAHRFWLQADNSEREVDAFYAATYVMSPEEVFEFLSADVGVEIAKEAMGNTIEILDKCESIDLFREQEIPYIKDGDLAWKEQDLSEFKGWEYINKFATNHHDSLKWYLHTTIEKLKEKGEWNLETAKRFEEEELQELWKTSCVRKQPITNYFATEWKNMDLIHNAVQALTGTGRGSCNASLFQYAHDFTQVNPMTEDAYLPFSRFIHHERPELPDVDIDCQSSKRQEIIAEITKYYESFGGQVTNVGTYSTETTGSALITCCRAMGINSDISAHMSAIVPKDRGVSRKLKYCLEGFSKEGYQPVPEMVAYSKEYPRVFEMALKIEGAVKNRSVHAAAIIITNGPIWKRCPRMRTASGLATQLDLKDCDYVGLIKFDLLSTECLDYIATALKMLVRYGKMEEQPTPMQTYLKYLHPKTLERNDPKMWELVHTKQVNNLFQFDTPTSSQGLVVAKPQTFLELAQVSSLIRLIPEKGEKSPIEIFAEFKERPELLIEEIERIKATTEEKEKLKKHLIPLHGVADSQESIMLLFQDVIGFSIEQANRLRKAIAKKHPEHLVGIYQEAVASSEENKVSPEVLDYLWNVQAKRQFGYGFSNLHVVAYTYLALQEMNIVYKWGRIFWDIANLIVDSRVIDEDAEDAKSKDYGKMSLAMARGQHAGMLIRPPNIDKSAFGFEIDEETNSILFGIAGITRINLDIAREIMSKRPYTDLADLLSKVKLERPQVFNLIKSRALDFFGRTRQQLIFDYLKILHPCKTKMTLANVDGLIRNKCFPKGFEHERQLYELNQNLRQSDYRLRFGELDFLESLKKPPKEELEISSYFNDGKLVESKKWEKVFKLNIVPLQEKLKEEEVAQALQLKELETEYRLVAGHESDWDMEACHCFFEEHSLDRLNATKNKITTDFTTKGSPAEPIRLAGVVVYNDKQHSTVHLNCKGGVVSFRLWKAKYEEYNKIISKEENGVKKTIENSWFKIGNRLLIRGYFDDENKFRLVSYTKKKHVPLIGLITDIKNGTPIVATARRKR